MTLLSSRFGFLIFLSIISHVLSVYLYFGMISLWINLHLLFVQLQGSREREIMLRRKTEVEIGLDVPPKPDSWWLETWKNLIMSYRAFVSYYWFESTFYPLIYGSQRSYLLVFWWTWIYWILLQELDWIRFDRPQLSLLGRMIEAHQCPRIHGFSCSFIVIEVIILTLFHDKKKKMV